MHTKLEAGIYITMLSPEEVTTLAADVPDILVADPRGANAKEIVSLITLHRAVQRGTDDSLRPVVYHVSSRTHKAYGQTADGRTVMQCPETGELVALRPCSPEPAPRVRLVSLEAART